MSILGGRLARPRQLVEVIAETLAAMEQASWAERARRELGAALRVGGMVAERAGFDSRMLADHSLGGEIALPKEAVFNQLRRAVTLDGEALTSRTVDRADLLSLIQPLTVRLAPPAAATSVVTRPLSCARGELILVAPSALTSAALDRVCIAAESAGATSRLLCQLRSRTEARVETLLHRLAFVPEQAWRAGCRLFRFDSDKLAYVAIVCGAQPAGAWSGQHAFEQVMKDFRFRRTSNDQVKFALVVTVSAAGHIEYDLRDEFELLVLTLDELEVVSDAYREEPLLLWHLLSQSDLAALARRSQIGALDIVGHADRLYRTSTIIVSPDPAFDPAEEVLTRGLERSGRQAAPDPEDRGGWLTVVRSLDAGADNVFERVAAGSGRIELFVRCRRQQGWVRAPANADRCDAAGAITQLAARLLSLIWSQAEFVGLERPQRWRLEVAWDAQQRHPLSSETRLAGRDIGVTDLIIGSAFLATLSRLDNSADRQIARAALAGWLLAGGAGSTAHAAASEAVDRVLPAAPSSLLVWPAHGEPRMAARLPPAPVISAACTYRVRSEIADVVCCRYAPGEYEGAEAREILNSAVRASADAINAQLTELAPSAVYALVACHERAGTDELHRGLVVPIRAALYGRKAAIDEYVASVSDEARRTLALRFLIEHATAKPLAGHRPPSDATIERLRMLADFLLDGAGLSDAVWKGLTTIRLRLPEAGPLAIKTDEALNNAQWEQLSSWNSDAPEHHQALTQQMLRPPETRNDPPEADQEHEWQTRLDDAWETAYGFRHLDMARVCSTLIAAAYDRPDRVIALSGESVVALGAQRSGVSPDIARRVVEALVLDPPHDYDPFALNYRPWRLRRKWSLALRPIVRWASEDGERLPWSAEALSKSGLYRTRMEQNGHGIQDPAVADVAARVRTARDREFNDEVADTARTIERAVVRARVTKIGGKRLLADRRDIGDIDVLVVMCEVGYVLALETKNFLPALNAYAIAHELERLTEQRGAIALHSRRVAWLIDNQAALSREFGRPQTGRWNVQGAIVVPTPLTTAFLPGVVMPMLPVSQVVAWALGIGRKAGTT